MKNFNKAEYEYNSSGLRTSKTVNGEKTDFILDGIYVIAEIKDGDVTNYIRGVTGIIYSKDKKGTKTYYVTNNHGDVTVLVNSSGNIVKEYAYDEYGVEANPDKEDTNPFRYCGEYYDTETGFIYLRARYYDPELGRFISEDPARDEVNWYIYSGNNPIMFIDPSGNIREAGYVNGVWCEDPDAYEFGNGSDTYKILTDLGNRWSSGNNSEKTKYSTLAEKVRKLARDGTPVQYAQNKIINELHKNAKIAKKFQSKRTEGISGIIYTLTGGNIFEDSATFLIGQAYGDWDYKYNSNWQVPYEYYDGNNMNVDNNKNWRPWMYFDGMLVSGDKFGNMNLGYVGFEMSLPEYVYLNFATTDKDDAFWVEYGMNMAKNGR